MTTGLLVVSAISAVVGGVQQVKQGRLQKRQNQIANKIEGLKRKRSIKRNIASSRIQIAQQQALGFSLGVQGGTAVQGAGAGVVSDTASSIGASNTQFRGQQFISGISDQISSAQGVQAISGAISNITGSIGSNEQATAGLEDFFGFGG